MLFKTLAESPSSIWNGSSALCCSSRLECLSCIFKNLPQLCFISVRIQKHLWNIFKVIGVFLALSQFSHADEWKPKRSKTIILSSKNSKNYISPSEQKTGRMVRELSSSNRWLFIKPKPKDKKRIQRKPKPIIKKSPPAYVVNQGRLASKLTKPWKRKLGSSETKDGRSANRIATRFPRVSQDNEQIGRDVWNSMQLILREPFMDEP